MNLPPDAAVADTLAPPVNSPLLHRLCVRALVMVSLLAVLLMVLFNAPTMLHVKPSMTALSLIAIGAAAWLTMQRAGFSVDALMGGSSAGPSVLDRAKRIGVGLAFVLWGVQALVSGAAYVALGDIVIVLFILDLAHTCWQETAESAAGAEAQCSRAASPTVLAQGD